MKYLKSLKKSEVGSNYEFYSNKDNFFSNELPYAVLIAIDDNNNGSDNNITIKYQWTNSNSITVYGQSNGSSDYSDFYLEAVSPFCVAIVTSNNVDYKFSVQLNYYTMDDYNIPIFGSNNAQVKKLALHEGIVSLDGNYISNGVNIHPRYSNGFGNLEALYLMNTDTAVTINNKPNNTFAQNTDLYVPSNLRTQYSSSVYAGFKSVNYF